MALVSGLVVAVWVDGELAEEFAGDSVHDADVEVVDEQDDVGSGVGSPDTYVMHVAVDAQGDGSGFVYPVVTDPVVGVGVATVPGQRFGHRLEQGRRSRSMGQGTVGSAVVVFIDEGVEQGLELFEC